METITVYWTIPSDPDLHTTMNMLWDSPKPLITLLPPGGKTEDNHNYRLCSGVQNIIKNTFAVVHPLTTSVKLSGTPETPVIEEQDGPWSVYPAPLKNSYRLEYDHSWAFFSEESVELQVTPPYMHNTFDKNNGMIASGSMDISKWFRPINLSYILWEGENSLTVKKGDPAIYFQFLTDKKIILKQFECTPEILSMSRQVVFSSLFLHLEPLKNRYPHFLKNNRHKRLLKLIKENLLD